MRTYDLVMLALLGIWWLLYRKKYDRNTVVPYYHRRGLFIRFLRSADPLGLQAKSGNQSAPAWLMPIGGLVGLLYGGAKGRLAKRSPSTQ
jgi:hypothetical protein